MTKKKQPLHTVADVARICQVTEWTVREWCKAGKLKATRPGRGWRIEPDALKEFLNERHGE